MVNKVNPDGRGQHAGIINRNGVAKLSHFMLTLSAPSTSMSEKSFSNLIGTQFNKERQNFVGWDQEGFNNLALFAK